MSKWSKEEIDFLKLNYSNMETLKICRKLNRNIRSISAKAHKLSLKKNPKYINLKKIENQFKVGNIPHNKGAKGWHPGGNSIKTRFKPGNRPPRWKPIGSERLSKDGILERKVDNTGHKTINWRGLHIILWEKYHGTLPKNHIVIFKNKNRQDLRIENLEAISRAENMRRNSIHNWPIELVNVSHLRGVLNRKINQRIFKNEK